MPDSPDDRLSSEELIRRARQGLDSTSPPPVPPAPTIPPAPIVPSAPPLPPPPVPSAPPETFAPIPATMPTYTAPPLPESMAPATPEVEPAAVATPPAKPSSQPVGFRPARSGDRAGDASGTLIPPGFEPASAPAPKQRSVLSRIKWGWLGAAAVAVYFVTSFFSGSKSVDDLGIGDCFQDPGVGEITTVDAVDCADPHDYEVFALVTLVGVGGEFPGDEAMAEEGFEACYQTFFEYVGVEVDDFSTPYIYEVWYPAGVDAWNDGSRQALCALYSFTDSGGIRQSTGTARAS